MRKLAFAVLVSVALAAVAGDTQSLVEAAKGQREKKKNSTTKVITNADVKKSRAVVAQRKPAVAAAEVAPQKSLAEQYETSYRERLVREVQLVVAKKQVSDLELELTELEQSYYEENNLDLRDTDVVKRFNEVKSKLDAARKELDALAAQETSSPSS